MKTKVCVACKKEVEIQNFKKNKRAKDGLGIRCLECDAERRRDKYNSDPKHKEERLEYNRTYYGANHDERRAYWKKYRLDNLEEVRAGEKAYYIANPHILLLKNARKRAKARGIPCTITAEDILAAIPADGRCPITGELFQRGDGSVCPTSMTLDCGIPKYGYIPGNFTVVSYLANTIKQTCIDPEVFRRMAVYVQECVEKTVDFPEPPEPPSQEEVFAAAGAQESRQTLEPQETIPTDPFDLFDELMEDQPYANHPPISYNRHCRRIGLLSAYRPRGHQIGSSYCCRS